MAKQVSKKARVLSILEQAKSKGISARELIRRCGPRSPARIFDLRNDGYNITTDPSRGADCRYVLKTTKTSKKVVDKKSMTRGKKAKKNGKKTA